MKHVSYVCSLCLFLTLFTSTSAQEVLPELPQFPRVSGFSMSVDEHTSYNCTPYEEVEEEFLMDKLEKPGSLFITIARDDALPLNFSACDTAIPRPGTSYEVEMYLTTHLDELESKKFATLSSFVVFGRGDIYERKAHYNETIAKVENGEWQKVADNIYSFTQDVTETQQMRRAINEFDEENLGTETVEQSTTFYRFLQIIRIDDEGVHYLVQNFPLSIYHWGLGNEPDGKPNQLTYQLDYPNSIRVFQGSEAINTQQQDWLGIFSLPSR